MGISREIGREIPNGAHLAGQLCDRLRRAAHRDRLDDARFRDLAALTGLAMRPNTAVAVRRVAHYGKRLFVQLTVISTHRQQVDGVVHGRGHKRVVVRDERHRVCRSGGIPQCIHGAWELDACRRFAERRQFVEAVEHTDPNPVQRAFADEFGKGPQNELSPLPAINSTVMPDINMILCLYPPWVFGGGELFSALQLR
jgi:hypothetical protein